MYNISLESIVQIKDLDQHIHRNKNEEIHFPEIGLLALSISLEAFFSEILRVSARNLGVAPAKSSAETIPIALRRSARFAPIPLTFCKVN